MKINNKYQYYKTTKVPVREDYKTESDFNTACTIKKILSVTGGLVEVDNVPEDCRLKEVTRRWGRKEIKIGATVLVERWDGNGIPEKVKTIGLKQSTSRVLVKTNKGYFIFSQWNKSDDNIPFTWTCEGKEWHKKYMCWVDGDKYYFKS